MTQTKKMNDNRKIVAYIRESTKEQVDTGYNLQDQERKIKNYLAAYDDELKGEVIWLKEEGASAKSLSRKQMKLLVELIESGEVKSVVIHNLDRLTRRVKDLSHLLELFSEHNVQLISITEKIDTSSAMGNFFIYLIVLMAQWEQDTISERTKRGVYSSAKEGNYAKSGAPFGGIKVNKKIYKDPQLEDCVNDLFSKILTNQYSVRSLTYYMKENYPNLNKWSDLRVKNILKNPIYAGIYVDKAQTIYNHSENFIFISEEEHEIIKGILSNRSHRYFSNKYIFHNLTYCINCARKCEHKVTNKRNRKYLYYYCPMCKKRINQDELCELLEDRLNKLVAIEFQTTNKDKIKNKLTDISSQVNALNSALQLNIISDEAHKKELESLEERLEALYDQVQIINYSKKSPFFSMQFYEQRSLLVKHVKKILISFGEKHLDTIEYN